MTIEELLAVCSPMRGRTKIISGVYVIYSIANQRLYIGSSLNIYKRLITHKNRLRARKHPSLHLQASWNKYGEATFQFLLLEEGSTLQTDLIVLENKYLTALDRSNLFNTEIPAVLGRNAGFVVSEETRKKVSASLRGKLYRTHTKSAEARQAQSDRMRSKGTSPLLIEKMHAGRKRKGYKGSLSVETKALIQQEFDRRIAELGYRPRGLIADLHRRYGADSSIQTVLRTCLRTTSASAISAAPALPQPPTNASASSSRSR